MHLIVRTHHNGLVPEGLFHLRLSRRLSRRVARVQQVMNQLNPGLRLGEVRITLVESDCTIYEMSRESGQAFFGEAEYRTFNAQELPTLPVGSERPILRGPLQIVVLDSGEARIVENATDGAFSDHILVSQLRAMEDAEPAVPAQLTTDDGEYEVAFDAAPYLDNRYTSADDISALAACDFANDISADNVAFFLEPEDPQVAEALDHARDVKSGFEVAVDGDAALDWLQAQRPDVLKAILADSRVSQSDPVAAWAEERTLE